MHAVVTKIFFTFFIRGKFTISIYTCFRFSPITKMCNGNCANGKRLYDCICCCWLKNKHVVIQNLRFYSAKDDKIWTIKNVNNNNNTPSSFCFKQKTPTHMSSPDFPALFFKAINSEEREREQIRGKHFFKKIVLKWFILYSNFFLGIVIVLIFLFGSDQI